MLVAKLYDDARRVGRVEAGVEATLRDTALRPYDVVVVDLSPTGCGIQTKVELEVGTPVRIGLPGTGVHTAHVVRCEPGFYGCAFDVPISWQAVQTVLTFDSVVSGAFERPIEAEAADETPARIAEPYVRRLPLKARFAIIIGTSVLLWAAIIGAVVVLLD